MISVKVHDNNVGKAISKLKNILVNEGLFKELKDRKHYTKPSLKKKLKREEAEKQRQREQRESERDARRERDRQQRAGSGTGTGRRGGQGIVRAKGGLASKPEKKTMKRGGLASKK